MHRYRALKLLSINGGVVSLNKDQARRRKNKLEVVTKPEEIEEKKGETLYKNGIYRVLAPIQFKKSELFKWTGTFGKSMIGFYEDLDKPAEQPGKKTKATNKPAEQPGEKSAANEKKEHSNGVTTKNGQKPSPNTKEKEKMPKRNN